MVHSKKIIFLSVLVILFILSFFSCQSLGEEQVETSSISNPLRVLFIGNSLTYYWELPLQVEALATDLGAVPKVETDEATFPGASLLYHLSPEYSGTLESVKTGGFNFVVIQGYRDPFQDPEKFIKNALALAKVVKAAGAEVVFYEIWAYDPKGIQVKAEKLYEKQWSGGNPEEMQARIREAYIRATLEVNGRMARVGDAWERVLTEHPEIELFGSDGVHPSESGSYLTACVFVNVLTNLDPRDAKWRPEGVSKKEGIVLRAAAWEVGQNF